MYTSTQYTVHRFHGWFHGWFHHLQCADCIGKCQSEEVSTIEVLGVRIRDESRAV